MSTRREAREWTVQLLFQLDLNPDDLDTAFTRFWAERKADARAREFTEALVRRVRDNLDRIDGMLKKYAEHWEINRMGVIDRNVIRMAICEMLFCNDIPPVVSINEAVDIAKYFSSTESGKFVNGILDRVSKDLDRPARSCFVATTSQRSSKGQSTHE